MNELLPATHRFDRLTAPRPRRNRFRAFAFAAIMSAAVAGTGMNLLAEPPAAPTAPDPMAGIVELATTMKAVGHLVEPSVVSIDVVRLAPGQQPRRQDRNNDSLKRPRNNEGDDESGPPQLRRRLKEAPTPRRDESDDEPQDPTEGRTYGEGSGVILDVDGEKAYVLTNNHVAGDAESLRVTLADGRVLDEITVLGTDPLTDLAVLEIKGKDLVGAKWGDSEHLEKGDIVLAFGAPFGYVGSMTQGIVSALNRQAGLLGTEGYENFIQTDCAINPGNSGGPLVNIRGEIVGINTAIASRNGAFNGIGFAIPSQLAQHVYEQIRDTGHVSRGFLGIDIIDASALKKGLVERLGLADGQKGTYVAGFRNNAPAEGALEPDDVIVSIDGTTIKNAQELRFKIATTTPGTKIRVGVIRDGKEETVEVTVGSLPGSGEEAAAPRRENPNTQDEHADMGATLAEPSASRLRTAGLPEGVKGALVTALRPGSPAALAGLEEGDLIIRVGNQKVQSASEATAALRSQNLADGIKILVMNRDGTRSIFIQTDE